MTADKPVPAMLPQVQWLKVSADQSGQRIDNFLMARLKGVPRSRIYRMLRSGEVRVDGGRVRAERRLAAGETVRVPPVREAERETAAVPTGLLQVVDAAILLERPGFLVVNKPAGLAVHGGSGLAFGLIEALRALRPQESLELVHRLDRDTSGCLLVARSRKALLPLQASLREGQGIDKVYQALAQGRWPSHQREVRAPLRKNELQSGERVVRVSADGKDSLTEFRVLRRFAQATLVEARPVTGRTHQIRVHARHAGHPLAGDDKYGDETFNRAMKQQGLQRLFLHAASLGFADPLDGGAVHVEAALEASLQRLLDALDA